MAAHHDLAYQLDRAGNATLDATCALRAASVLRLPAPHRRLLNSAIRKLEGAQQDMFHCRTVDPWPPPKQPPRQMTLTL